MTYTLRLKQPKPPAIENQGNGSLAKGFGQILYEPIVFSRLPFTLGAILSNIVVMREHRLLMSLRGGAIRPCQA
jgi:hypothetical protein